jgi:hypothetical protein
MVRFPAKAIDVPLFQSAQINSGTYQVSYAMGMGEKQPWREAAHSPYPMPRFKSPSSYILPDIHSDGNPLNNTVYRNMSPLPRSGFVCITFIAAKV